MATDSTATERGRKIHANLFELLAAADALSVAAQTTGGTAGTDPGLVAAIERYAAARRLFEPDIEVVDIVQAPVITTPESTLLELRRQQRLLDKHEAELRRLASYQRHTAGMKDDRRRHSEAAQICRDRIRSALR